MNTKSILWTLAGISIIGVFIGFLYWYNTTSSGPTVTFTPQKRQLFAVGETTTPFNVLATTLPEFAVKLADEKFNNLWQAHAQERQSSVDAEVVNAKQDTSLPVDASFNDTKKEVILTPSMANQLKPGLYKLNAKIKTIKGDYITITQDFTWGVLAINTGKAIYKPGDNVKIGMGVLDDLGHTKCIATGDVVYNTAKVWLTITSPSGKETDLSTDDGTIVGSKECAATSVTNNPDFQAQFVADEVGKYTMHMTAQNINGKRSIEDSFSVSPIAPVFDVMRTSYPTRIYPLGYYPVEITVVANQDYSGAVSDIVPSNFRISEISDGGFTAQKDDFLQIVWHVDWQSGHTYKLKYTIGFPLVSPEFYLVGPLTIGDFKEGREWQIASDAISLVQKASNVADTGTSISATLGSSPTAGHLMVVVCADNGNLRVNTMATNGGNNWSSVNITSSPRQRVNYRIVKAGDSATYSCPFQSSGSVISIQVFEYSGNSTSSVRDQSSTKNASCSSGSYTTNTITITNPIELIFAAVTATATTARNVTGHTSGFTQEFAFSGSSAGTFTTADQSVSSIAGYSDTVTYTGNAGTCSGAILSFITPINISQNGYRFFANQNSTTPGSPLASANTDISLATPQQAFRMRFLLDVDGTQTLALQAGDFILEYATLSGTLTCSTASYDLVSTPLSQSAIAYNPQGLGSGVNITSSGNDPTDTGYTTVLQSYYEDDTSSAGPLPAGTAPGDITNDQGSLTGNQAGLWDVSLIDNTDDTKSNTYCLKIINATGTDLSTYVHIPKVTTFYNEVNIKSGTTIQGGTTIQ